MNEQAPRERISFGAAAAGTTASMGGLLFFLAAAALGSAPVNIPYAPMPATLAAVLAALSFLSHMWGGWVAGRIAGRRGTLHGAGAGVGSLVLWASLAAVYLTYGLPAGWASKFRYGAALSHISNLGNPAAWVSLAAIAAAGIGGAILGARRACPRAAGLAALPSAAQPADPEGDEYEGFWGRPDVSAQAR